MLNEMEMNVSDPVELDFYFDPLCPWAWRTALWARQVARKRPLAITWKLFSLAVVNHGSDYAAEAHAKGFRLERALIAARRLGGNEAVERLYMALGNAYHGDRADLGDEAVIRGCLAKAELPEDLYDRALADPTTETDLLAEHKQAIDERGAFGVPTLALAGSAMGAFGPIIQPIPTGAEALALWDHTLWLLQRPYVWELKRERTMKLAPQHVLD